MPSYNFIKLYGTYQDLEIWYFGYHSGAHPASVDRIACKPCMRCVRIVSRGFDSYISARTTRTYDTEYTYAYRTLVRVRVPTKFRPSHRHPYCSAFAKYRFSVTPGTSTCSKLFNKRTNKITEPERGWFRHEPLLELISYFLDPLRGIEIAKRFRSECCPSEQ